MSLFKARNWWSTQVSSDENESFDRNSLLIARMNDNEHDNIVIGSHSGCLRVYKVSTERQEDGTLTQYKPTDLVLEKQLPYPILGLGLGRLVSGSQKWYLGILHPLRVTVYSIQTQEGITDHGDQNHLVTSYEHIFQHSAYSMIIGSFGGVQGRDFICVQSLDGHLNFYEQESVGFECSLPNFLIPSPMCYVMRTDSFVTLTSAWCLESYRYQNMSQSERSGRLTPTWSHNLGESVLQATALPLTSTETVLVLLGEKNLHVITDLGGVKYTKKLDYVPVCLHAYVIGWYWEPDARLMVSVASDSGTLLLYEDTALKWSAVLPHATAPAAMCKASVKGLSGVLVTLSSDGRVQCSYLGTEPELFQAPPAASLQQQQPIVDYEEAKRELENLNAVIKSNADSADAVLINSAAEKELQIIVQIDSTLKPLPTTMHTAAYNTEHDYSNHRFRNTRNLPTNKQQSLLSSRIHIRLKPASGGTLEQLQIQLTTSARPLRLTETTKFYRNVVDKELNFETYVYVDYECNDDNVDNAEEGDCSHIVSTMDLDCLVSFVNAQGCPRVLRKRVGLPLSLVLRCCEIQQREAEYRVVFNINRPCAPLNQLFPEFSSQIQTPTAVGFVYINSNNNTNNNNNSNSNSTKTKSEQQRVVSILIAKNSQRYRLQSNRLEDLCLPVRLLCRRLQAHFDNDTDFRMVCSTQLPLAGLLSCIDEHFSRKTVVFTLKDKLAQLSAQYRLIQRRLLSKLKDKIPSPLSGLERLLQESLGQIKRGVMEFNDAKRGLTICQSRLNAILDLVVVLLRHMNLDAQVVRNVSAVLCTPVQDLEEQSWEDITDVSVVYLLRTLLSKDPDLNNQLMHSQNVTKLTDCNKFKQHIVMLLDKVAKEIDVSNNDSGGVNKDDDDDIGGYDKMDAVVVGGGGLPDVEEENENEFDIPEGLKLAERKVEVFRSRPLLEMRHRIVEGSE